MASVEYTLFEQFVAFTDVVWWYSEAHPYVGAAISSGSILGNWAVFRYHYSRMNDPHFLLANIHVAGRFSLPTFEMWKTLSMSLVPFGLLVLLFTAFSQARSVPFIALFGIRGAGNVKLKLVKHTLRNYTALRYMTTMLERMRKL